MDAAGSQLAYWPVSTVFFADTNWADLNAPQLESPYERHDGSTHGAFTEALDSDVPITILSGSKARCPRMIDAATRLVSGAAAAELDFWCGDPEAARRCGGHCWTENGGGLLRDKTTWSRSDHRPLVCALAIDDPFVTEDIEPRVFKPRPRYESATPEQLARFEEAVSIEMGVVVEYLQRRRDDPLLNIPHVFVSVRVTSFHD